MKTILNQLLHIKSISKSEIKFLLEQIVEALKVAPLAIKEGDWEKASRVVKNTWFYVQLRGIPWILSRGDVWTYLDYLVKRKVLIKPRR